MADNSIPGDVSQVKAPLRHGRRAAVMPTDMVFARTSISAPGNNETQTGLLRRPSAQSTEDEDMDIPIPRSLLPGLSGHDLPPFLTGIQSSESINGDEGDE